MVVVGWNDASETRLMDGPSPAQPSQPSPAQDLINTNKVPIPAQPRAHLVSTLVLYDCPLVCLSVRVRYTVNIVNPLLMRPTQPISSHLSFYTTKAVFEEL